MQSFNDFCEYPRLELIELVEWYAAKWPQHREQWDVLLERAKNEDFSDFDGEAYQAEKHYELEADLIIDPPDPEDKTGSDWSDFI